MKSLLSLSLLTFLVCSFVSCSKELSKEKGYIPGSVTEGNFYATIDGTKWNADSLQLIEVDNSGIVTISGIAKTGEVISMIVPLLQTGSYPIGGQSLSYAAYTNLLNSQAPLYSTNGLNASGYITITSIDTVIHQMSGSFEFTLVDPSTNDTKTITKGIFNNVSYSTGYNTPQNGNKADTLNATIDSNPFLGTYVESQVQNGQLLIAGINIDTSKSIALIMPANVSPGTYNLDFTSGQFIGVYYPSASVTLVSLLNGTLTIISNDTVNKRIQGTFGFTATPAQGGGTPADITNGYFAVNY